MMEMGLVINARDVFNSAQPEPHLNKYDTKRFMWENMSQFLLPFMFYNIFWNNFPFALIE